MKPVAKLKYNEAIAELESILEAMKSRNCDIDALTQMTRRAAEIIEECRSRLTNASSDLQDILEKLGK
ncbi:MAG: exodeoxyribonuclease VII small subunit [Bacteroidales bacterium]|nr:exodeoxyribonuclease VII small subunit [Bacteroidales bacterium]